MPIGKQVVGIHPRYFRPAEVDLLIGDATKANTKLGWKPKYDLAMLVADMVSSDVALFKKEKFLKHFSLESLKLSYAINLTAWLLNIIRCVMKTVINKKPRSQGIYEPVKNRKFANKWCPIIEGS